MSVPPVKKRRATISVTVKKFADENLSIPKPLRLICHNSLRIASKYQLDGRPFQIFFVTVPNAWGTCPFGSLSVNRILLMP